MQDTTQHTTADPRTLLVDLNIRHDSKADADLIASVKEHGVIVPINVVRTASGELRVRHGHRRATGAPTPRSKRAAQPCRCSSSVTTPTTTKRRLKGCSLNTLKTSTGEAKLLLRRSTWYSSSQRSA